MSAETVQGEVDIDKVLETLEHYSEQIYPWVDTAKPLWEISKVDPGFLAFFCGWAMSTIHTLVCEVIRLRTIVDDLDRSNTSSDT